MGREHKGCESCLGYLSGIARASSTRALSTYVGPLFRAQRGARAIEILDEEINEFSVIIPLFFFSHSSILTCNNNKNNCGH